jgi:broad specificity phosphatase PhoE
MKTIILIQHCQSEHHVKKMIGGAPDWKLTEYGCLQANNIGRKISAEFKGNWIIYSSDLKRAEQIAEIIAGYMSDGQENIISSKKDLREQDFGIATGKSLE